MTRRATVGGMVGKGVVLRLVSTVALGTKMVGASVRIGMRGVFVRSWIGLRVGRLRGVGEGWIGAMGVCRKMKARVVAVGVGEASGKGEGPMVAEGMMMVGRDSMIVGRGERVTRGVRGGGVGVALGTLMLHAAQIRSSSEVKRGKHWDHPISSF